MKHPKGKWLTDPKFKFNYQEVPELTKFLIKMDESPKKGQGNGTVGYSQKKRRKKKENCLFPVTPAFLMASSLASSVFLFPLANPKCPRPSSNPNPNCNPRRRRKSSSSQSRLSPISACSASSFRNGSPRETECPVPLEQQPVNEYQALSTSLPFSWAAADLRDYCSRLAFTGVSFALFVGFPVAAFGTRAVSDPEVDGLRCALGAVSTGLLAVTLAVVRMYLGWAYVGNRLLSATVECKNVLFFLFLIIFYLQFLINYFFSNKFRFLTRCRWGDGMVRWSGKIYMN